MPADSWCVLCLGSLVGCGTLGNGGTLGGRTALPFEGEIEMRYSSPAPVKPQVYAVSVKGDRMRVEMTITGAAAILLLDASKGTAFMLNPASHEYTEYTYDEATHPSAARSSTVSARKENRRRVVLGYSCDEYTTADPKTGVSSVVCLGSSPELGDVSPGPWRDIGGYDWMALAHAKGLPLQVASRTSTGAWYATLETTRIERKPEPDSRFEVPPGYAKVLRGPMGPVDF